MYFFPIVTTASSIVFGTQYVLIDIYLFIIFWYLFFGIYLFLAQSFQNSWFPKN